MKKVYNTILKTLIIFLIGIVFFTTGLIIGNLGGFRAAIDQVGTQAIESEEIKDAEAQYYRGAYDVCIQQIKRFDFCREFVRKMTGANWYNKPSSGWEWPLAASKSVALSP